MQSPTNGPRLRLAIGYESLGPYHLARLQAVAKQSDILAVEFSRKSATYDWQTTSTADFQRETIAENALQTPFTEISAKLNAALTSFRPDVVFVPGWAAAEALAMLHWCRLSGVPAVVMSDSQEIDSRRSTISETVKSALLSQFDGAFVAGQRHTAYLNRLGFHNHPIATDYDVVDNQHFAHSECMPANTERKIFLCCARFVKKKNLFFLLRAYREFLDRVGEDDAPPLVIVGDGPLRSTLEFERNSLGLNDIVHMPGYIQYDALPAFYHAARCFILPSTVEQWGLVVNEAMAAGCPVLVSERAGCVPELVKDGQNGFHFDPDKSGSLADKLVWLHQNPEKLNRFGDKSLEVIDKYGLDAHAKSVMYLARKTMNTPRKKYNLLQKMILRMCMKQSLASRLK